SYFLGKSELIRRGLQPIEEPGDKKIVTDNSVLYHFSGSDKSTISWVLRNRVEAGIINNHKFDSLKERIRSRLKVIHHSPAVPRHVVSFRPGFSADTISQISRVLIAMESDRTGQSVLQQFQKTKKFDLISKQTQQNLQQLKDMIQKITPP
ncbi:MAG: PhnD/SsuA/transferrin family substrate-binding protein, partial [Gammaproteobacteria bacterium]|nr:PhnD/SsuA/transferrin family substrate-binding protein [Gammaproteobacteria bacterium]